MTLAGALAVALAVTALGLAPDWLNSGPTSLLDFGLPAGFSERVHTKIYGGLTFRIADRFDQIRRRAGTLGHFDQPVGVRAVLRADDEDDFHL